LTVEKEKHMKMISKFAMAGVLAIMVSASSAIAEQEHWAGSPAASSAVLYDFASVSELPTLADGPVKETCSQYAAPTDGTSAAKTKPLTEDEAVKFADSVNIELAKKLAKKMSVSFAQPTDKPAVGSLVFTGCFIGGEPGNAAKRLAGVGLGASHLSAHVRVFYVGGSGPVPVEEFDLAVKGSNKLPPLGAGGLAFNAVSDKGKGLQGDCKRLAGAILKRLKKDQLL
jgi:hypothetical protein